LRVLIVDDNAAAREILENMIRSLRFEARSVCCGDEAIGELEEAMAIGQPYQLVIMDWMMPQMDGVETMKRIRESETISHTPAFVMVTAYSRDELMQKLGEVSVEGILTKPLNPSGLYETILGSFGTKALTHLSARVKTADYKEIANTLRGSRILLVEDNLLNQELAVELLEKGGIWVDIAQNGAEALEKVTSHVYDGVLMDCQMPIMDGFEATEKIRLDARFKDLPIIAMTANAMEGDRERCLACGMNDHIAKPLDILKFFQTLTKWIVPSHPILTPQFIEEGEADLGDLSIEGIDVREALDRMAGNGPLLLRLLERFTQTQRECVSRIRIALENGALEEAVREAHSMKGLLGNIGAHELFERFKILEKELRSGHVDEIEGELAVLERSLNELIDAITAALERFVVAREESSPSSSQSREEFEDAIAKLRTLLEECDSDAVEWGEKVVHQLKSMGHIEDASALGKRIGNFDFEGASEVLDAMQTRGVFSATQMQH
jgi:CheY-like chemotaxis protein